MLRKQERTYDDLAKRCGMTYNGVAKIAKHQNRSIQYATMEKLTQALNITANDLFGYFSTLREPQIAIRSLYPLSDKNRYVFRTNWQIANYDLELQFTVVLTPTCEKQAEVEFCLDDVLGDYSEDFLYSLLQSAPETFHEAIAASVRGLFPDGKNENRKSYKVVFSVGKENNLFYVYKFENDREERGNGH